MDSHHILNHHKWIYIKLGSTYFFQSRSPVEESLERSPIFHVLILNECDVYQYIVSISWVEIETQLSVNTCILQDDENKYKEDYELICNGLFSTLYQVLFGEEVLCLSPKGKKIVKQYGDWYMTQGRVYIKIFGSTNPPHWLPHLVPDTLLL